MIEVVVGGGNGRGGGRGGTRTKVTPPPTKSIAPSIGWKYRLRILRGFDILIWPFVEDLLLRRSKLHVVTSIHSLPFHLFVFSHLFFNATPVFID